MIKTISRLIILTGLLFSSIALSQTVYVTDKVLLGLYRDQEQNELIKVIPTGTPLEIVSRDGNNARVRGPDGVEGWVDASYLINDKPAQLMILDLTDEKKQLETELSKARQEINNLKANTGGGGNTDALQKDLDKYKQQYESANKTISKLEQDNKALEQKLKTAGGKNSDSNATKELKQTQESLATAEKRIQALEKQLAEKPKVETKTISSEEDKQTIAKLQADYAALQKKIEQAASVLGVSAPAENVAIAADKSGMNMNAEDSLAWILVDLVVLLIGFALGAWWLDRRNLKRHGGIRI